MRRLVVALGLAATAAQAANEWTWQVRPAEENGEVTLSGQQVTRNATSPSSTSQSLSAMPPVVVQAIVPTVDCTGVGRALQYDQASDTWSCHDAGLPSCNGATEYLRFDGASGNYVCATSDNLKTIPTCNSASSILLWTTDASGGNKYSCASKDILATGLPGAACDAQTGYLHYDGTNFQCLSKAHLKTIAACTGVEAMLRFDGTNWSCGHNDDRWVNASGDVMTGALTLQTTAPMLHLEDTNQSGAGKHYWLYANSGTFYLLQDRNGDGAWDNPHPLRVDTAGRVILGVDPTTDSQAATKRYVDARLGVVSGASPMTMSPGGIVHYGNDIYVAPTTTGTWSVEDHLSFRVGALASGGSMTVTFNAEAPCNNDHGFGVRVYRNGSDTGIQPKLSTGSQTYWKNSSWWIHDDRERTYGFTAPVAPGDQYEIQSTRGSSCSSNYVGKLRVKAAQAVPSMRLPNLTVYPEIPQAYFQ